MHAAGAALAGPPEAVPRPTELATASVPFPMDACAPARVAQPTERHHLGVAVDGDRWLPLDAIVWLVEGPDCADDAAAVVVVADSGRLRHLPGPVVEVGQTACVGRGHLRALMATEVREERLPPDIDATARTAALAAAAPAWGSCARGPETLVRGGADAAQLGLISAERALAMGPVKAAWQRNFGPLDTAWLHVSPWGRVQLPYAEELDAEALAAEWAAEGLDTAERREKATVAVGPTLPGAEAPAWTHFLGTDTPWSDDWAQPAAVAALVDLFASWYAHCRETVGAGLPARACTVQVGDLAYPSPRQPDPLGHTDHHAGTCVDVRLFRSDGAQYEAWWNRPDDRPGRGAAYSPELTGAFIAHAMATAPVHQVIFNDPAVRAAVPGVDRAPGHDDHLHMCLDVATGNRR